MSKLPYPWNFVKKVENLGLEYSTQNSIPNGSAGEILEILANLAFVRWREAYNVSNRKDNKTSVLREETY